MSNQGTPDDAARARPGSGHPLGWAASGTVVALALLLAGIRATNGSPFDPWYGTVAFGALYATPGIVGCLATLSGSRSLFVAAAAGCVVLAVTAFSGVTLPLLIPAICFLLLAADAGSPEATSGAPRGISLLGVLAGVLVLVTLLTVGVVASALLVLVLFLAAILARGRSQHPAVGKPRTALLRGLAGIAIVGLVVAACVALFSTTDTVCWERRVTASGLQVVEVSSVNSEGPVTLGRSVVGEGCDSGELTLRGSAAAVSLEAAAVALAALLTAEAARRAAPLSKAI